MDSLSLLNYAISLGCTSIRFAFLSSSLFFIIKEHHRYIKKKVRHQRDEHRFEHSLVVVTITFCRANNLQQKQNLR